MNKITESLAADKKEASQDSDVVDSPEDGQEDYEDDFHADEKAQVVPRADSLIEY